IEYIVNQTGQEFTFVADKIGPLLAFFLGRIRVILKHVCKAKDRGKRCLGLMGNARHECIAQLLNFLRASTRGFSLSENFKLADLVSIGNKDGLAVKAYQ